VGLTRTGLREEGALGGTPDRTESSSRWALYCKRNGRERGALKKMREGKQAFLCGKRFQVWTKRVAEKGPGAGRTKKTSNQSRKGGNWNRAKKKKT